MCAMWRELTPARHAVRAPEERGAGISAAGCAAANPAAVASVGAAPAVARAPGEHHGP